MKGDRTFGLETLSEFLLKHFGSKIFVLVDAYDSRIMKTMFLVETKK